MPKPVTILLIEDNAGDILLIRQALAAERLPVRVTVAMDGEQALQIVSEPGLSPDLVILDLHIPKGSGLSFLQRSPVGVPVVVFSTSTNSEDRDEALKLGAKECIQKPSDLDEFVRVVSQMVRKWACPDYNAAMAV